MNVQAVSDEELWNAAANDDTHAFTMLYQRHWLKLYRTTCSYLKDKDLAEQVLQDVFIVLWRRRKALTIESFKNYIFITARYQVFKILKARKINPIIYLDTFAEEAGTSISNEAWEKLEQEDFEYKLKMALSDLPKRCQEIFWMSRVENRTNDEIAENFGISKRTVENQLTHALKQLRLAYREMISDTLLSVILLWLVMSYK